MSDDREWYVVAKEPPPPEGDSYVYVFGPFVAGGETDARAYALDLGIEEEGLGTIDAIEMPHATAQSLASSGKIMWPYSEGGPDDGA